MRWISAGLLLALVACHGPARAGVDVAFDVDSDGSGTSVKCMASTGGSCQIEFGGTQPMRAVMVPGEMRRFVRIGPGAPVCVEAKAADLAGCRPVKLGAGYVRIRKDRPDRLAHAHSRPHAPGG